MIIQLHLNENSEELYGVRNQPKPTCPTIDNLIQYLRIHDKVDNHILSELESIRQNAKSIREWGEEWKQLCKVNFKYGKNIIKIKNGFL